ncbi:MAG: hypothetical protein HZA08_08060 [Nitrospirae bacterium]|nr:hypothetical protein [Nitrospirota bacterium]
MYRIIFKRFFLITVLLFGCYLLNTTNAFAHKGHAGPTKVFMEEKEALKTMLPKDDKIVKRKELLKKEQVKDAVKRWGYSPDEGVYTYFISKDKEGNFSGALFIREFEYKHGNINIAIGYNKIGEVTVIKVISCSEKHLKELTENIESNGFLYNFSHLKIDEVISKGKSYENESKETLKYIIAKEIEGTAILFKLFQGK